MPSTEKFVEENRERLLEELKEFIRIPSISTVPEHKDDVHRAADCPAIDAWRASLQAGSPIATPAPEQDCPANFGNTDIGGGSYPDPTP